MDIHSESCYTAGHETKRNSSTVGGPQTPCCRFAAERQNLSIGSRHPKCFDKLSGTLGPRVSEGREKRSTAQADTRPAPKASATTETKIAAALAMRSPGGGLFDRSLDLAANRQADRKTLWDSLSPRPRLAGDGGSGMDLAETETSRHPKERGSDCPLEEERMAADKKKPKDLRPILPSSMKVVFCSFLTCGRPGLPEVIRRSSDTATRETESRPFLHSLSLPPLGDWDFIFASITTTSREWRWSNFCGICCTTCEGKWFCSGMAEPSTDALSSRNFCSNDASGFISNVFPPMLQNLIRTSSSGPKPRMTWPILPPRISFNSKANSAVPCTVFEILRSCCDLVFMLLICRGLDTYIHYLCETQ